MSWPDSTITAHLAAIYDDIAATTATKPVPCLVDFGEDVTSSNAAFNIDCDAAGIARVTVI